MNVVHLAKPKSAKTPATRARHIPKILRRQKYAAVGVGVVATTLTALSLSHLAHGITIVTGSEGWEAWAMAVGIDLGFVAMELAQLMCSEKVLRAIGRYAKPAILGTLAGSAAMNAFAFAGHCVGWMIAPAVLLGVAIPALIYALTRIGGAMYVDCHARAR